jgi:VanZ family protein
VRALRFLPALAWAALIFWLSSQPDLPTPPFAFEGFDKLVHAGFYGILTLLLCAADGARPWWWVVAAALYGLSDEIHQAFVPGRSTDAIDLFADIMGALLVASVWRRVAAHDHRLQGSAAADRP